MTQPSKIFSLAVFGAVLLLLPSRVTGQSGTVTDDGFLSTNSTTQKLNLGGQGISLIVGGASSMAGSPLVSVGQTTTYIKFQLQSSLPQNAAVANVTKATLKLFLSPSFAPSGAIDIYPVTSTWTESTLTTSSPPTLATTPIASGVPIGSDLSFVVVDVTALVQEWLNGPANGGIANDGIALVAHTSATYAVFDSKESIVTSHEPRLEIVLANTGLQGPAGPQGAQGPKGDTGAGGAPGTAATIKVEPAMVVPPGTPPSVMNGGTPNAADLTFILPQGAVGPQGARGPIGINNRNTWISGTAYNPSDAVTYNNSFWLAIAVDNGSLPPPGNPNWQLLSAGINSRGQWSSTTAYNSSDAVFDSASYWLATAANTNSEPSPTNGTWQLLAGGIVNRGVWSPSNSYKVNDVVFDSTSGSSWLALQAIPANTPNSEPSSTNASWQLLAQQGAQGPQGPTGQQGPQGIQGLMGFQGPPGAMPTGAAITTTANTFTTSQTINGNLILSGAGAGVQFADGTLQVTAASGAGGPSCPAAFEISSSSPVVPLGYAALGQSTVGDIWFTMSPTPTARGGLAAATLNGKIYAVGGTGNAIFNTSEVFDPSSNTWSAVAPMPTARYSLAAAALNGKIYAIGGVAANSIPLNTMEVFDPSTNTWSAGVPMPTARFNPTATTVNGKIYVMGGFNGTSLNTVEVFDPSANTWNTAPSMPTARNGHAAATVNGKIYVMGGASTTVDAFDPSTNTWSAAASMPRARVFLAAAAVNGKIYAIGGQTDQVPLNNYVQVFDPSANSWSTAASMPTPRSSLAASDGNGLVYAIGGFDSGNSLGRVEQYQPPVTIYTFTKE